MSPTDLLEENIILNTSTRQLLFKTVKWSRACAIGGLLIALVALYLFYRSNNIVVNQAFYSILVLIEWLLFLFTCLFLLLFAIKLKSAVSKNRSQLVVALRMLRISMVLLIVLLIIAIANHLIWNSLKLYVFNND